MYGTVAAIAAYYGMMFVGDAAGLPQIVTMGIQVCCRESELCASSCVATLVPPRTFEACHFA